MKGLLAKRQPKLCLAASGGGHLRQILDLEPAWKKYPHVLVTEDTALGRSLAERFPTRFVPHFALGQARLGKGLAMIRAAAHSFFKSARIIFDERPDIVVTTGAGSQLFIVFWARLTGARVVLIDSFARFDRPSSFARLAGFLAHVRIAQSRASGKRWPGSLVFDPFRTLAQPRPEKEPLLFATVGATLPFERLVSLVVMAKKDGLIPERVIVQSGEGFHEPVTGIEFVESLPFDDIQNLLKRADLVVCHGGTGSLITALREGCRVIAVPRRFNLKEHYDEHQSEIVAAFTARGLITFADTQAQFSKALAECRVRTPIRATTDPVELINFLDQYFKDWPTI